MSVESISLVLNHSKASGTDKLVLIGIANHDGDGGAWPSIATLARYANVTERSVQAALRRLEAMGELRTALNAGGTDRTDPRYRSNRYCIHISGVTPTSPLNESRGEVQRVSGVKPTSPEPSLEPSLKKNMRDEAFEGFWQGYPKARRISKPAALSAWRKIAIKDHPAVMAALGAWVVCWETSKTEEHWIPYPQKWLNQRYWENPPEIPPAPVEVIRPCIMCAAPNPRQECNGPSYIGEDFDMGECPWRR